MCKKSMGVGVSNENMNEEYLDKRIEMAQKIPAASNKLRVFISSKCGDKKYNAIREEIKKKIEETQLANVYLFEAGEASTLSAQNEYLFELEDSDVCIFLIDNADGVPAGVQNEIDTVRKKNIMALYYFCDEHSKEKTAVEKSLTGAQYSKTRTIHSFSELAEHGAQGLIDDIVRIYHHYCKGRIAPIVEKEERYAELELPEREDAPLPMIPKAVLKNTEKSKNYFVRFFVDPSYRKDGEVKSNEIDEWGLQFLSVLFEGKSIKQFNTAMFLEELKKQQDPDYYRVVEVRWRAIQAYFTADIEACIVKLEEALILARNLNQPDWIINDILIDLRNMEVELSTMSNVYKEPGAQKELNESKEDVYYPILDRINESLQEKYLEDMFKYKTESPFAVTIGDGVTQYCELIASSYIVSLYNGSLTHIRRIYNKVIDFLFFLSDKYDDWTAKRDLLMMCIFEMRDKEARGLRDSFPEILNGMKAEDASRIMDFCNNHPIPHKRLSCSLLAFEIIGYYLNEKDYINAETLVLKGIEEWLNGENEPVSVGNYVFKALSGMAHRIKQDKLAKVCCMFIDKHYSRWYMDMFRFIANSVDLRKMEKEAKEDLIAHIHTIFEHQTERDTIKYSLYFLARLRQQDRSATDELDDRIKEHFPIFYDDTYRLETTDDAQKDMPLFIEKYVARVKKSNATQGVDGHYVGHGSRDLATIRAILINYQYEYDATLIDSVIEAATETLLYSKEDVVTKMDAASLLSCIVYLYPCDYDRNRDVFLNLYNKRDEVKAEDMIILTSNINEVALRIAICVLFAAMKLDVSYELLDYLSHMQNDVATTIFATVSIAGYLEVSDRVVFPKDIERIVLQNTMFWFNSDHMSIRWNAARILLALLRNQDNAEIIDHKLLQLIDTQPVAVKTLIMRQIFTMEGISESTRQYVISKCQNDPCFVVRMVCREEVEKQGKEK